MNAPCSKLRNKGVQKWLAKWLSHPFGRYQVHKESILLPTMEERILRYQFLPHVLQLPLDNSDKERNSKSKCSLCGGRTHDILVQL